jgi:hypothetical protein
MIQNLLKHVNTNPRVAIHALQHNAYNLLVIGEFLLIFLGFASLAKKHLQSAATACWTNSTPSEMKIGDVTLRLSAS